MMNATKSLAKISALALVLVLTVTGCESTANKDGAGETSDFAGGSTTASDTATVTGLGETGAISSQAMEDNTVMDDQAGALETVFYFDFDKATLREETRAALDAQAAVLKNSIGTVRLEGHADERGTREYNMALGERRAIAIANYLALQGVARSRLDIVSYGEEKPVSMGHDEASWQQNRRVELVK